jgi:hypothetical protein
MADCILYTHRNITTRTSIKASLARHIANITAEDSVYNYLRSDDGGWQQSGGECAAELRLPSSYKLIVRLPQRVHPLPSSHDRALYPPITVPSPGRNAVSSALTFDFDPADIAFVLFAAL